MRTRTRWALTSAILTASVCALALSVAGVMGTTTHSPDNLWGDPAEQLVTASAQSSMPVETKQGCRIATPGIAPWLAPGSKRSPLWEQATYSALQQMGLPKEAASLAVLRMKNGQADGAVGMSNLYGVGSGSSQLYLPIYHTSYRKGDRWVVCRDSATAFGNDERQEWAVTYKVPDATGTIWHVGEFLVCGNVSVFIPAPLGWMPPRGVLAPAPAVTPPPLVEAPHGPETGLHGPFLLPPPGVIQHQPTKVAEPGSLVLVLAALASIIYIRRTGKK